MRVLMYCTFFACLLTLSTAVRHYLSETDVARALQMLVKMERHSEESLSASGFHKVSFRDCGLDFKRQADTQEDPDKAVNA